MSAPAAFTTVTYRQGGLDPLDIDGGRVFVTRADGTKAVAVCLSYDDDIRAAVPVASLPGLLGVPLGEILSAVQQAVPEQAAFGIFARLRELEAASVARLFGATLFALRFNDKERSRIARQVRDESLRHIREVFGLDPSSDEPSHFDGHTLHITDYEQQQLDLTAPYFENPTAAEVGPLLGVTRWQLSNAGLTVGRDFQPKPDVQMRTLGSPRAMAESFAQGSGFVHVIRMYRDAVLQAETLCADAERSWAFALPMITVMAGDTSGFRDHVSGNRNWLVGKEGVEQVEALAQDYYHDQSIALTVTRPDRRVEIDHMTTVFDDAFDMLGEDVWRAHQTVPAAEISKVLGEQAASRWASQPDVPLFAAAIAAAAGRHLGRVHTFAPVFDKKSPAVDDKVLMWLRNTETGDVPRYVFSSPPCLDPAVRFAPLGELPERTLTPMLCLEGGDYLELLDSEGPVSYTLGEETGLGRREMADWAVTLRGPIPASDFGVLWVDAPVVEAMAETASHPVWLNLDELPADAGVAWFARELVRSGDGAVERLTGFSWVRRSTNEIAFMALGGFVDEPDHEWVTAEVWVNPSAGDGEITCRGGVGRLAGALFNLLNLPRTVETSTDTITTETRDWNAKRTKKVTKTRTDRIKVVTLRVGVDHAKARPGGDSWHYKHRFWVSGHLRFQPYRSQLDDNGRPKVQRIWIDGYVKGPEGAPWMPKRDKVIHVRMGRPADEAA